MSTVAALPRNRSMVYAIAFVAFALILSGCGMLRPAANTANDGPEPMISEAASAAVIDRVAGIVQTVKDGEEFTVTATQDEVSSFLVYGSETLKHYSDAYDQGTTPTTMQIPGMDEYVTDEQWDTTMEQLRDSENRATTLLKEMNNAIHSPLVYLQDGEVILTGTAELAGAEAPLRIVLEPVETGDEIKLQFVEAQLGGLQAPEWVGNMVEEGLDRAIRIGQRDVRLTSVVIEDGEATVTGIAR